MRSAAVVVLVDALVPFEVIVVVIRDDGRELLVQLVLTPFRSILARLDYHDGHRDPLVVHPRVRPRRIARGRPIQNRHVCPLPLCNEACQG